MKKGKNLMKDDRKHNAMGQAKEHANRADTDLQPRSALLRHLMLSLGEIMISLGQQLKKDH